MTLSRKGLPRNWRRRFGQIVKEEMQRALVQWREGTLPKHFQPGAGNIYKYQPRTNKYQKRKRRKGLGPMVYSGDSRRKMLADAREPKGGTKRVVLRLKSPRAFHKKFPGWDHRMADEITKVTKKELTEMYYIISVRVARRLTEERSYEKHSF